MRTIIPFAVWVLLISCTDNSAPSNPTDIDHTEVHDTLNMNRDTLVKLPQAPVTDSSRNDSTR